MNCKRVPLPDFHPKRYDVLQHEAKLDMTQIGTLSGIGKLWDGNNDLGPVGYEIRLIQDAGPKRGEGILRWAGRGPWDSFQAGKILMLMLKSGEQVSVTINSTRKEGADILATGAMPDPVDWSADD